MSVDFFPFAWLDRLDWFFSRAEAYLFGPLAVRNYVLVFVVLVVTVLLEIASRKNWRLRYGSRSFRIDVLYYLFYYSGLYHLLVLMWIYKGLVSLIDAHAPWLQFRLFDGIPPLIQFTMLTVIVDFLHYWNHRWRHANRFLWAFHSIHHSQTVLTVMATYRFHIIDETFVRICMFLPFQILFGTSIAVWIWLDFLLVWLTLLEHSAWKWSYGYVGRIFVSPYFHRIHHSTDERLQNCNFGGTFSFWDDLFGTAERKAPCPSAHGLASNPVDESLLGHFVYPFVTIACELGNSSKTALPSIRTPRNVVDKRFP